MGYIDDGGNETKNAVLKPEREPCECPECGSAASHADVELHVALDGYSDGLAVCSITVPDSNVCSSGDECAPHVLGLSCDDCGYEWKPIIPITAVLRVVTTFGE